MSADNWIYIAKFSNWFRVVEAQAIDNIYSFPDWSKEKKDMLNLYFWKSEVFNNINDANVRAKYLANEAIKDEFCPYLEYGIVNLWELEDF
jgi:hypothetical protein